MRWTAESPPGRAVELAARRTRRPRWQATCPCLDRPTRCRLGRPKAPSRPPALAPLPGCPRLPGRGCSPAPPCMPSYARALSSPHSGTGGGSSRRACTGRTHRPEVPWQGTCKVCIDLVAEHGARLVLRAQLSDAGCHDTRLWPAYCTRCSLSLSLSGAQGDLSKRMLSALCIAPCIQMLPCSHHTTTTTTTTTTTVPETCHHGGWPVAVDGRGGARPVHHAVDCGRGPGRSPLERRRQVAARGGHRKLGRGLGPRHLWQVSFVPLARLG